MKELMKEISKFNEERDWDKLLKKLEKTKKKYPVEKAKGVSTKYNKL